MSLKLISSFSTAAFVEVDNMFSTGRLWQEIDDRLPQQAGSRKAIFNLPEKSDPRLISMESTSLTSELLSIIGVWYSGFFERTVSTLIPVILNEEVDDLEKVVKTLGESFYSIAEEFDVEIMITKNPVYVVNNVINHDVTFHVAIVGLESHIKQCEVHLIAILKLFTSGIGKTDLFVESLDLPSQSILPFCIGVDMINIKHFLTTYNTRIMTSSLVINPEESLHRPKIYFTGGNRSLVSQAKYKMTKFVENVQSNLYYTKFTNVSPGKLLYLQKYCQNEITKIMVKFNSYIRVTDESVEFQAVSPTLLEMLTKTFTIKLLHKIVEVQIIMKDHFVFDSKKIRKLNLLDEKSLVCMMLSNMPNQLVLIGKSTNEDPTKPQYLISHMLASLFKVDDFNEQFLQQIKTVFEIHPSYEDFISGKKNGKLTRIIEVSECLLNLDLKSGDENMFLTLIANNYTDFLSSFSQVLDELPAEDSFFIPEVYHRPAIGAGGSIIQTTMRKHNVFIQFSNSFLLPQNEFSHIRYDNVIIRCPKKNEAGIKMAKKELNTLAQNYGFLQLKTLIKFTPGQYRHILDLGTNVISDIEKNMNVYILFPFQEPEEGYFLEIRGNNKASVEAANELVNKHFGLETEIQISDNIKDADDFENCVAAPFIRSMGIHVTHHDNLIRLTYYKDNKSITEALQLLQRYLDRTGVKTVGRENFQGVILDQSSVQQSNSNLFIEKNINGMGSPKKGMHSPIKSTNVSQSAHLNYSHDKNHRQE